MAKSLYQKLKLLYLLKIFREDTDENHGLSMEEIIKKLALCNIEAERKSLYDDMDMLDQFGYEIIRQKIGHTTLYSLGNREFSVGELKLLVDAVQSSRFLTKKKSEELTEKLTQLLSRYDASSLKRQVQVTGRVKTMNETIFISVDSIYAAMSNNHAISFEYHEWNENRRLVLRKDGHKKHISPWAMVWDNEFYYLVAYDPDRKGLRHYRVDKIKHVNEEEFIREGKDCFLDAEIETYVEQRFSMFAGEKELISIECPKRYIGPFIDRFGEDMHIRKLDEDTLRISFHVAVTPVFFGWITGLGDQVRIVEPKHVVSDMAMFGAGIAKRHAEQKIRAVIFDLGMVLVDFRYHDYMIDLGFDAETIRFFEDNIVLSPKWLELDRALTTEEEAIQYWKTTYPLYASFLDRFFEDYTEMVVAYSDSKAIVKSLRDCGYEVYLLTNYPDKMYDIHSKCFPFTELANGVLVSAKLRMAKPDRGIFEHLLREYNLSPEECIFLDDREENIKGARSLGIRGIVVNHREEAFRKLFDELLVLGKYGEPAPFGETD